MTDPDLLSAYLATRSDEAFRDLVNRHLPLVYAAALRQLRDPHLAEDASQAVFLVLIKKAASIRPTTLLPAWLLTTTRYVCKDARKLAHRRQRHEQKAAAMTPISTPSTVAPTTSPDFAAITPHLDDALASLPTTDRAAILLRYFDSLPLKDIGAALQLSESTTQKRLKRALQKLRAFFAARNLTLSITTLPLALAAHTPSAVPSALLSTISALHATTALSHTAAALAKSALHSLYWTPTKIAAAAAALLVTTSVIATAAALALRPPPTPSTPVAATLPFLQPTPSTPNPTFAAVPDAEAKIARAAITTHFIKLHNLQSDYTSEFTSTPNPRLQQIVQQDLAKRPMPPGTYSVMSIGTCTITGTFSILNDRQMNSIYYPPEAMELRRAHKWVAMQPEDWILTPDRIEHLDRAGDPIGTIEANSRDVPSLWNIDYGLGLRSYGGFPFLTEKELADATLLGKADGKYTLEVRSPSGMRYRWTFDPTLGYALVQHQLLNAQGNVPRWEIQSTNFRAIDGILLPFKVELHGFDQMSPNPPTINYSITTTVQNYRLNDPANTPEKYRMVWPAGSAIVDQRTNQTIQEVSQTRTLTDEELKAEFQREQIQNLGQLK